MNQKADIPHLKDAGRCRRMGQRKRHPKAQNRKKKLKTSVVNFLPCPHRRFSLVIDIVPLVVFSGKSPLPSLWQFLIIPTFSMPILIICPPLYTFHTHHLNVLLRCFHRSRSLHAAHSPTICQRCPITTIVNLATLKPSKTSKSNAHSTILLVFLIPALLHPVQRQANGSPHKDNRDWQYHTRHHQAPPNAQSGRICICIGEQADNQDQSGA